MYAIRRHRAAIKAWCWRVHFKRRGKLYSKSFFNIACGDSKNAKAQAVAWRDRLLAELKGLSLREFHEQRRSNSVSGVAGVHFHKSVHQPLGYWQAKLTLHDGKSTTKTFSVRTFGRREAFRLAVAARSERLAKVENRPYLYDAVAKRLSSRQ